MEDGSLGFQHNGVVEGNQQEIHAWKAKLDYRGGLKKMLGGKSLHGSFEVDWLHGRGFHLRRRPLSRNGGEVQSGAC